MVEIGAAARPLKGSQLGWLTRSEDPGASELTVKARSSAARFLLFAGQPLREPMAFGGPFVMNTQVELQQASEITGPAMFEDFIHLNGLPFPAEQNCMPTAAMASLARGPIRLHRPAPIINALRYGAAN